MESKLRFYTVHLLHTYCKEGFHYKKGSISIIILLAQTYYFHKYNLKNILNLKAYSNNKLMKNKKVCTWAEMRSRYGNLKKRKNLNMDQSEGSVLNFC